MAKIKEIWKDIEGYDRQYQISSIGSIRSIKRGKVKPLKPQINTTGYFQAFLSFKGKVKSVKIGEYDGLPKRLDVCNRLTAIGNSIDPRVVFEIFKAMNL